MASVEDTVIQRIIYSRRRTLALEVTPAGELVVKAPRFTSRRVILDFVNRKERWWQQKIALQQTKLRQLNELQLTPPQIRRARREAFDLLQVDVRKISRQTGLIPSKVALTNAKTQWGSCNSRGIVRLNWRLALVPARCRTYVVLHELVHLRHLNHSQEFWQTVGLYCPEYASLRKELGNYALLLSKV